MAGSGQLSLIGSDSSSTKSQYVPRLLTSFLQQSNSDFSAPAPQVYLDRPQDGFRSLNKTSSHQLHQTLSKRLYWAIALAQTSLISSIVALVLLVINGQKTHNPDSSLIAWFTASSIVTIALALTVGIMWDQRRKRRWMPSKPSLLGLRKQDDIYPQDAAMPPSSGRKRTLFHRLASKNSLSQVNIARNTPVSETNQSRRDQPPSPKTPPGSRHGPTTRGSVSPARTMDSESSLAGEGYELHYIRSALSSPSGELPPSPSGSVVTPKRPNPVRLPPLRTDSHTLRHGYRSPAYPDDRRSQSRFGPIIFDIDLDDDNKQTGPPPVSPAGSDEACSEVLYRHSLKPVPPLLLHERSWLALSTRDDVSPLSCSEFCSQYCLRNCNHNRRNYSPPSALGPAHEIHSLYAQLSAAFDSPKRRHHRHRAHAYNESLAPELTSRFSPGSSNGSISGSSNNDPVSPASSSPTTTSDKPSVAASLDLMSPIVYGVDVARDVEMFSAPPSMISLETLPMPPQSLSSKNLAEPQTTHSRTQTRASRMPSLAPSPALTQSRPQTAQPASLPTSSGTEPIHGAEPRLAAWERRGGIDDPGDGDDFFAGLANSPSSASLYCSSEGSDDRDDEDVWPSGRQPSVAGLPLPHASVPPHGFHAANPYFPPVSASAASLPAASPPTPFGTPSIGAPLARQQAVSQLEPPSSAATFPAARGKRGGLSRMVRGLSLWNKRKGAAGSRSAGAGDGRPGFI